MATFESDSHKAKAEALKQQQLQDTPHSSNTINLSSASDLKRKIDMESGCTEINYVNKIIIEKVSPLLL